MSRGQVKTIFFGYKPVGHVNEIQVPEFVLCMQVPNYDSTGAPDFRLVEASHICKADINDKGTGSYPNNTVNVLTDYAVPTMAGHERKMFSWREAHQQTPAEEDC